MADLRQRLVAFYQRHNPTNLAQIDAILTAWGHNEAELWRQMAAKYGQLAVDDAAAAWRAPPATGFSAPDPRIAAAKRVAAAASAAPPPVLRPIAPPAFGAGFAAAPRPFAGRGFGPAPPYAPPPQPYTPAPPPPHPWDLLAEVCAVAALPREASERGDNVDAIERVSEERHATATHEACCARRCLQKLSEAGKEFTRQSGGFLKALRGGAPLVTSVGGASGSADTTFVLVDRMLLLSLRASLHLVPAPASTAHAAGATAVAAFAAQIQRAAPWRAAVAVAAARPAAAGPSADDAARALRRDLKDAKHRAKRETGDAIAALRRLTARRVPGLNDPWALPRVTNEFFDALSAVNPDSCSDGRKLAETSDGDALAALLDVLRFAAGLDALSQKQQALSRALARVREWTGSVGAVVERAGELSGGFQRRRGDASGGGARAEAEPEDSVRLGMSAAAPAGVATEKRPAAPEAVAAPEEADQPKRRRVAGRLVAYDDEGHRPKAWRRDLSPKKPATRRASKGARVAFADGSKPVAVDTPAPVADPQRQAQQRRLLGRRMDRAIWDAFRSREFAPIEALLAHGADAGYVRTEGGGETALMAAAYHGREEICRALLSKGADPRKQDKRGHDAAALARVKGNATLATLLDGVCLEPVAAPPRAATPPPPEAPATAKSPKQRGDDVHPRLLKKNGMDDDDDPADDEEAISRSVALPEAESG